MSLPNCRDTPAAAAPLICCVAAAADGVAPAPARSMEAERDGESAQPKCSTR